MKRQLSSFDLYVIVSELQSYLDYNIEKIYQISRDEIVIKIKNFKTKKKVSLYIKGFMEFNKNLHIAIEEDPSNMKAWYNLALQSYDMCDFSFALDFCNYLLEKNPNHNEAIQLLNKIKKHNPSEINYIKTVVKRYLE